MILTPIEHIFVQENRQRKEFDPAALAELGNDIEKNGLYHPIVVRRQDNDVILVAGERRLRAIRQLNELHISFSYGGAEVPLGMIPTNDLGELLPLQAEEIELHENIKREQLSWQERVEAEARLVALAGAKAVEAQSPPPSLSKIAKELDIPGVDASGLSQSIHIAKHLHDPDVRKAKSKQEAFKVVERKRREEYDAEIAKEMGRKNSNEKCKVILGDSFEQMLSLPANSFDVLFCDPPYYINADTMGEQANNQGRKFDDSAELFRPNMKRLAKYSYILCKEEAHAFVFCSIERFDMLKEIFQEADWDVWPRPLIWDKGSIGALPRPNHGPRYCYEAILFASKMDRPVYANGRDVIPITALQTRVHPDEKPVALYEELLSRVTRPGNAVLDPFCGSGTIFAAANRLSLLAVGIEGEESYYNIALRRLDATQ